MKALSAIAQRISDRTNPMVVKELRQAVQSRLVIAMLLLFLLVNVIGVCGYLMLSGVDLSQTPSGASLFSGLFVLLVVTCMVFVPVYSAVRMTMERNDSNIDLLFITTLSPGAIIRGKFWAAAALTALIYSACFPFLTFTYLLRGIDLPSIFLSLSFAMVMTLLANMLAIFVGSVAGGLLMRVILGGVLFVVGYMLLSYAVAFGLSVVQMGMASMLVVSHVWLAIGLFLLSIAVVWSLLYLLAVAAVSARSSNRMFPIRVFLTVSWIVFGVVCLTISLVTGESEPMIAWMMCSMVVVQMILPLILCEREEWNLRVRRTIPRNRMGRAVAWLFFTGSAGGVIWCVLLGTATLLVTFLWGTAFTGIPNPREMTDILRVMSYLLLYSWCYTMSGLFLRRKCAPRSAPPLGSILALLLLAVLAGLPILVASLIYGNNWRLETIPAPFLVANPMFLTLVYEFDASVTIFLIAWAVVGLLVNFSWFRQQWRAFEPFAPAPVPSPTAFHEEPAMAHV